MNTEQYCKSLDELDKVSAIRAIHEAYLTLSAIRHGIENVDFESVMTPLAKNLRDAGHIGFIPEINSFQRDAIARLAARGVLARVKGNWIECDLPNGDNVTIMTTDGLDLTIKGLDDAEH